MHAFPRVAFDLAKRHQEGPVSMLGGSNQYWVDSVTVGLTFAITTIWIPRTPSRNIIKQCVFVRSCGP